MGLKDFGATLKNKGNSLSASFKDYTNKTELNSNINRIKLELNEQYQKLGLLFYRKLTIAEPCEEEESEIATITNKITELLKLISDKETEISAIEAEAMERKAIEAEEKAKREEEKARREQEKENQRKLNQPVDAAYETAGVIVCSGCGSTISKVAQFCPVCGAKQANIVCPSCGAIVKDGAFCMKCGAKLEKESALNGAVNEEENYDVVDIPQVENVVLEQQDESSLNKDVVVEVVNTSEIN